MIIVKIREVALVRGIRNPAELSRDVGVSKPTAKRLWEGESPPDLPTLDKICEAWGCKLDKLVQYQGNGSKRKR